MNTRSSKDKSESARRTRRVLAVTSVIALALAVSPTALAAERGRPGTLSVAQASFDEFLPVLRDRFQFVSWSD